MAITNEQKERSLSQAARDAADELVRRAQEILQKDVIREPELEPAEAARVTELEVQIATIGPKMQEAEKQINANETRLKELQGLCSLDGFLRGEDLDALVNEREHLKLMQPVMQSVINDGLMVASRNNTEIRNIKVLAREREVQNGK